MFWTLRKKILIGYSIVLVLMVIILVWALVNLIGLGRGILKGNYMSILAADNMSAAIERQNSAIFLVILGHSDEGFKQFHDNEGLFLQWLETEKDYITEIGESEAVKAIEIGYSVYLDKFTTLRAIYQVDPQKSARFYYETMLPSFQSVRDSCDNLREINQKALFRVTDQAQFISRRAFWSMTLIGIAAIGIGLGFSLLLSNVLVKPLRQIMEATQKIAVGNYDVEVLMNSHDELGGLASRFNEMAKKVKSYYDLNIDQIIAEKQKSEAIIGSIDDGIVVVDTEFKVTNMNPMAAKALGIELDKAQGEHFLKVVRNEWLYNYVKQSFESGQPPPIEEGKNILILLQGEEQRQYHFSITPAYAKNGSMLGVVLLLRDVTKLRELDRLKSDFVMMASHELRTPLTTIVMSIDFLMENARENLNEKEQKLLSAAYEELQRLITLVSDLLDLSKIEEGKMELEFDRVPVLTLFEKAVVVLKPQADEKSIDLSFETLGESLNVKADATKITWVLVNLISNALRYTNSGGHILLFAERIGARVHISVSDDGKGIPYEYQSKIFDKFVQIKSDREGGSGLGLSICREIIRAHGGAIWVDSTPGKGSVFTFSLTCS